MREPLHPNSPVHARCRARPLPSPHAPSLVIYGAYDTHSANLLLNLAQILLTYAGGDIFIHLLAIPFEQRNALLWARTFLACIDEVWMDAEMG